MEDQDYTPEQITAEGRQMYEERLKSRLEPGNKGRILVIDIKTGEYEMDDDALAAAYRAHARLPGAVLYGMRIGYPSLGRIGGWGDSSS